MGHPRRPRQLHAHATAALVAARDLLADPTRWSQGFEIAQVVTDDHGAIRYEPLGRRAYGTDLPTAFDAFGAIKHVVTITQHDAGYRRTVLRRACDLLLDAVRTELLAESIRDVNDRQLHYATSIYPCDLGTWNDRPGRTHAQILAGFDRAIAHANKTRPLPGSLEVNDPLKQVNNDDTTVD